MDKLKPMYPPFISQRGVVTEWGESQRAEGIEEGRVNALLKDVKNLMQNTGLPAEKAMAVLDVSEPDRKTEHESCRISI